jgi:hypothetical protein
MELEQLQILKMLEAGRINADEAATLLAALESPGAEAQAEPATPVGPTAQAPGEPWQGHT